MTTTRPPRVRRELYANTVAAWAWGQGTLIASVLCLPLLTRFLPKAEFGLWAQLLAFSALATLADFGMSSVFVRRLASEANSHANLRSATGFYVSSASILAVVLLGISLLPGGVLEPFVGKTTLPKVAAVVIIIPIVINLALQPYALRILARGRVDIERVFGAGPTLVGTLTTVLAAYWFRSALAMAVAYAVVEIGFDVALVVVASRSVAFRFESSIGDLRTRAHWRSLVGESLAVFVVGVVPQLTLLVDAAVIGRIEGPIAVAIYAAALRVGDLVPRFFTPFTDSLFVSLCRATGRDRWAVVIRVMALPWVVVTFGLAVSLAAAAIGSRALSVAFGAGYESGVAAFVVLLLAATLRSMYMPGFRRLQADTVLGRLPVWFVAGVAVHLGLAVLCTAQWSILGTAFSVLIVALVFETLPIAWALRQRVPASLGRRQRARLGAVAMTQVSSAVLGVTVVLLLTWYRLSVGGWSVVLNAVIALALGGIALSLLLRYLKSSRLVISA